MRGSHAKPVRLRRTEGDREVRETLVVPVHRQSKIGTVRAIYR